MPQTTQPSGLATFAVVAVIFHHNYGHISDRQKQAAGRQFPSLCGRQFPTPMGILGVHNHFRRKQFGGYFVDAIHIDLRSWLQQLARIM